MTDSLRDTLGAIWRLCEQMSYAAEHGYISMLGAQYNLLQKRMIKLDEVIRGMEDKNGESV